MHSLSPRFGAVAVVAVVVAAAAGCIDPTVPDGALISCTADADCPDGFVCQEARALCVAQANLDETPPVLRDTPTISPERGSVGTVFTLSFAVSEVLAAPPTVTVDIGGNQAAFVIDDDASDADNNAFVFTYTANGAEAAERPSPVRIDLLDRSDNPAIGLAGGVIVFDFSAPAFVGAPLIFDAAANNDPPVTTTVFGPLATVATSFATTELLGDGGAAVELLPLSGGEAIVLQDQQGATPLFLHVMTGAEIDGDYALQARLTDASGNDSEALVIGFVTLDLTPPSAQVGANIRAIPDVTVRGDAILHLRAESTFEVVFVASEPLGVAPRVFARCGNVDVDLERVGDTTSSIVFVERLAGLTGLPEGDCDVRADLQDVVGNLAEAADVLSPAFTLDTTAPAAPAVDVDDAIVYARTPWGSDATAGAKRFTISGAVDAGEAFATVAVYESEDAAPQDAISRSIADDAGAFALTLTPVDRAVLFVAQIDLAGNEGPRARVRDVVWTATMGGKVAGSTFINPHRFESRALFSPALRQGAVVELGNQAARADGSVAVTTGAATWQNVTEGANSNPDVELPMITFDPARSRLVVFGGASCSCGAGGGIAACVDTFERNDVRWSRPVVSDPEGDGDPPPIQGAAMVFDTARGLSVLFGTGGAGDVWEFNGTSWRRACVGSCAASGPSPRQRFAAAYDPVRRRSVLFGGRTATAHSNETWEWDGGRWQPACVDADCGAPPARAAHAMVYDDHLGAVLAFGGDTVGVVDVSQQDGGFVNDVWSYNGTWTQLCTDRACVASKPSPRSDVSMAFDAAAGATIIYGGLGQGPGTCDADPDAPGAQIANLLSDTVVFDGSVFTTVTPIDPEGDGNPGVRRRHGMTWDPRRQRVILVGGVSLEPCFSLECSHFNKQETWEWNGSSWQKFVNVAQPTTRDGLSAAFDASARNEVVLVGTGAGIFRFGERWRSSGTLSTTDARVSTSGAGAVMFGGLNGTTVSGTTSFVQESNFSNLFCFRPPCIFPPGRFSQASAESPLGGMVMFGGAQLAANPVNSAVADTWQFTGSSWRELCVGCVDGATRPSARFESALAFDADRRVNVLFGGQLGGNPIPNDETWESDGTTWTRRAANGPPGRGQHTLVYDRRRQKTILFGGFASGFFGVSCGNGRSECDDLWEFDGRSWTTPPIVDVELDGDPGARFSHAMAWSPRLDKSVMFGGGSAETWLYDGGGDQRPAQVMGATFAAAGTDGDESILDIDARFVAGGTGDGDDGARLLVWDVDGWRALAENDAAATAPQTVSWRNSDSPLAAVGNVLPRVFFGTERTLFFAVSPVASNGGRADFGEIDTDAAEVTVRYRLPR